MRWMPYSQGGLGGGTHRPRSCRICRRSLPEVVSQSTTERMAMDIAWRGWATAGEASKRPRRALSFKGQSDGSQTRLLSTLRRLGGITPPHRCPSCSDDVVKQVYRLRNIHRYVCEQMLSPLHFSRLEVAKPNFGQSISIGRPLPRYSRH